MYIYKKKSVTGTGTEPKTWFEILNKSNAKMRVFFNSIDVIEKAYFGGVRLRVNITQIGGCTYSF